ncbi:MAG: hypothetical protein H3C34_26270, partial [Caldilineaceae bacterium]|nr:hypothetical protein [Caldilineaceae bacterium]
LEQKGDFPFLAALAGPVALVQGVANKPYVFYLTELHDHEDELLDAKEQVLEPLRRFMNGSQKQIYLDARRRSRTATGAARRSQLL